MNWAQENKTLAGIVGVMAAGGIGLGVWLYLSWSGYSSAMEEWSTAQDRIASIRSKKLEPTAPNVTRREADLTEYANKVNQLRNALLFVQKAPTPMSETEFQTQLKDRATAVKNLAKTLGMKALADDFALGFEKYASQPPRSAEIASELALHLEAVEKVVTVCIESGAAEINLLNRTELANEAAPLPDKPPPTTTKKAPAAKKKGGKAVKTLITEQSAAEPVLDRYPIKIMVTTDSVPFQAIINTLSNPVKTQPHFLVVRQVRVENTRQDGPTKEEVRQKMESAGKEIGAPSTSTEPSAPSTTEPAKEGAAQLIVPPKPAPPDALDILGGEMLKVYMEVDYIRFRPAAKVEDEDAPAAPGAATPAAAAPAAAPAKP